MRQTFVQAAGGGQHIVLLDSLGDVYTCGWGHHGQLGHDKDGSTFKRPRRVSMPREAGRVTQAVAGGRHTVFLDVFGHVYTCGYGVSGQLGDGKFLFSDVPERMAISHRLSRGVPGEPVRVAQIAAGEEHTVLLSAEGSVYACGRMAEGQLGDVAHSERGFPSRIASDERKAVHVSTGNNHTVVVYADGGARMFGRMSLSHG